MKSLFGIDMTAIMVVLVVLFAACIGAVAAIFLSNRIMFRMGLRNVRRRRAQTALIVVGLMLATLIITAAFTTGDSIGYSITKVVYDNLQRTDITLHHFQSSEVQATPDSAERYVDAAIVPRLEAAFAGDQDIEGFIPGDFETLPVLNARTRLSEPVAVFSGVEAAAVDRYGGLHLQNGGQADLSTLGVDRVLIDQRAADKLDARVGDVLTTYAQGQPHQLTVAGIVKNQRASGEVYDGTTLAPVPGIALPLTTLQQMTGHEGKINDVAVVLHGDVRSSVAHADAAARKLESLSNSEHGRATLGMGDLSFKVEQVKHDSVDQAELAGTVFTTLFMLLGLFSIAAGIMLIFTIFVMLAAERKTEMGIARAVGASRMNLVQSFVAEGMAYDLLAGVVGAALGVAAAVWLIVGGAKVVMGEQFSFMTPHVSVRSLAISYSLGVVLTFLTIVLSVLRISRLNIVAAVRGTEERGRREHKQQTNWRWVALGIPALIIPPLGLYWLLRKGFGLAWAWVFGPAALLFGVLLILAGKGSGQLFPFTLGMSLLPLGAALLATYYGASRRLVWTAVGIYLAIFWLLPTDAYDVLFGHFESGGMEMFVLSGVMIVTGFTLIVVFNARLLNRLLPTGTAAGLKAYRLSLGLVAVALGFAAVAVMLGNAAGGLGQLLYLLVGLLLFSALLTFAAVRFPWFTPALKMGVAYPLANRFRTGMTIAMFALIIFSLTMMSVINADMLKLYATDEARGSWDVAVSTSRNNPVPDLAAALREAGPDGAAVSEEVTASGRLSAVQAPGLQKVRQAGRSEEWSDYTVRAGDASFFEEIGAALEGRASGYATDRAVYDAVKSQPNLAVIDFTPLATGDIGSAPAWTVQGVTIKDHTFTPFTIDIRDPISGRTTPVTVIGVLSAKIPPGLMSGILTNEQTYAAVYGAPEYTDVVLRLAPGVDGDRAAKAIKASLLTRGVQATAIKKTIDDLTAQSQGLLRIFQAFMALGLFVGIAGLGVIAFRSVVERRQQIGMLRAIGYQRRTVELSFLLESSFIALMGIISGVVGALILARNLLTSDYFGTAAPAFFIPWLEVIVFAAVAYGFALLMTWWPSRQAGRTVIAEALRYE